MASIELKQVDKTYPGGVEVIRNLNLAIADREFVVFVGPSGCGKSTTLRMIAGLEEITNGSLYIGDRLVNDVAAKDRDIAMVFQNYALYPHMTVYKNMSFGLELRKIPKDEIRKKVMEAAEMLDLTAYLDRKPKALSGGQRQRVALGRALVRDPAVFLLDEPLSNLDAKLRTAMRAEILKLHKRLGTTFVYVTHDQTEAMTMGDRICVMNKGQVQQFDAPQILFDNPANCFVAGFIGSPQMNFFRGTLQREAENWFFVREVEGTKWILPSSEIKTLDPDRLQAGQAVILGIRPEGLRLSAANEEPDLRLQAELTERLGAEAYLYLKDEAGTKVVARVPAEQALYEGTINLNWDRQTLHLFEQETGRSLKPVGRNAACCDLP